MHHEKISILKCHQHTVHAVPAATMMLGFAVWIVMGHTGDANPALMNAMQIIPSIILNNGKIIPLKMFRCAT
jgi:hypothetical protein